MTVTFSLSSINIDTQGFNWLANLFSNIQYISTSEIVIDCATLQFGNACLSAPLEAVLSLAKSRLNSVKFINLRYDVQGTLTRIGLLSKYGYSSVPDYYQNSVLLEKFSNQDISGLFGVSKQWVRHPLLPKMTENAKNYLTSCLDELFSNAQEHAQTQQGIFTCGQVFPKKNTLVFCLSDTGTGIPHKVRRSHASRENWTDQQCVEWALQEGNSTRHNMPGGLGLTQLQNFVCLNRGAWWLATGSILVSGGVGKPAYQLLSRPVYGSTFVLQINTADRNEYCLSSEAATPSGVCEPEV